MLIQNLRNKLQNGKTCLGTWLLIHDPSVIEIFGLAGFDFAIIDMEHGSHDLSDLADLIRSAELSEITPLVRPCGVDGASILKILDCGTHGIMVPNISSVEEVDQLKKLCFYPPVGKRGHSPFTRAGGYSHVDASERMKSINNNLFVGILIEGEEGILNLRNILDKHSSWLDVIYVGLYDLAKSVGLEGDIDNPIVDKKSMDIAKLCIEFNVNVGILSNNQNMIKKAKHSGFNFICYQNDTGILHESCKKIKKISEI